MNSSDIRNSFVDFFEKRDHKRLPSAPLIPAGDPTLLFTSAGMVQFKPYFLGQSKPPARRLTTVQKCFRTSDIESVGDASHLTFFEMLGNFSIGDYFKPEVIPWAWEYVTKTLQLEADRLWTAVYLDDDEAFELWRQQGVPESRIMRYGEESNYWYSGDVGPCGPCSEIHYDFGPTPGCPECTAGTCHPEVECGRFLEIWNLVFMAFFCEGDTKTPLPSRNIDTGAGLERLTVVKLFESDAWTDKSVHPSVYDTDLFRPIIERVEQLSGKRYGEDPQIDRAMRIVAEHGRAVTFLIGDERTPVIPSNEGQGYVARRILRRAVYFGRAYLGLEEPFLGEVASAVIDHMAHEYPELERQRKFVLDIIAPEERRFEETLNRGLGMLDEAFQRSSGQLTGADAFLLHDTYGFPLELTAEIARDRGFSVDVEGFEAEMGRQRERARSAVRTGDIVAATQAYASLDLPASVFAGYDTIELKTTVLSILETDDGRREVFLAETPFYPEGGGQVGDRGEIVGPNGRFQVEDTQRVAERLIVHRGRVVEGTLAAGETVTARVDRRLREETMRNHTGTHLLHAALRQVLGTHVRQAGSLVAPDRLRFDFTHSEALTPDQMAEVQSLVNEKIRQNVEVHTRETTFDEAMNEGVIAFFGDKYGEHVRVVEVNGGPSRFSAELCGGTHVHRTGDIGLLLILGESSIGSGARRIEALTGRGAEEYVRQQLGVLDDVARRLGAPRDAVAAKLEALLAETDAQRRRIERLERSLASAPNTDQLLQKAIEVDGVRVLATRVDAPSPEALRYLADAIRNGIGSGAAVLGTEIEGRPFFLALVTKDLTSRLQAGQLLKEVAVITGGGGGGRPDMAQGGGKDLSRLDEALSKVPELVRRMLARS